MVDTKKTNAENDSTLVLGKDLLYFYLETNQSTSPGESTSKGCKTNQ